MGTFVLDPQHLGLSINEFSKSSHWLKLLFQFSKDYFAPGKKTILYDSD